MKYNKMSEGENRAVDVNILSEKSDEHITTKGTVEAFSIPNIQDSYLFIYVEKPKI